MHCLSLHLRFGSSMIGVVTPAQSHCSLRNCHLHCPTMVGSAFVSTVNDCGMLVHMSTCISFRLDILRHITQCILLQLSEEPPPDSTGLAKCIAQESNNLHGYI